MSNLYSGQDGVLYVGDKKAAKVRSWSFTANQAVLETVSLGDTERTLIPGIRSLTGSCSIYYYQTTAGNKTPEGGVTTFIDAFIQEGANSGGDSVEPASSQLKLKLAIDDGTTSMRYIEMYAWITSLSMTSSVGEVIAADISFEADGCATALTL